MIEDIYGRRIKPGQNIVWATTSYGTRPTLRGGTVEAVTETLHEYAVETRYAVRARPHGGGKAVSLVLGNRICILEEIE